MPSKICREPFWIDAGVFLVAVLGMNLQPLQKLDLGRGARQAFEHRHGVGQDMRTAVIAGCEAGKHNEYRVHQNQISLSAR